MTAFFIVRVNITDRVRFSQYEEGFGVIFEQFGGKILSVDEKPDALEGDWSYTRSVLLEFPDKVSAMKWYNSPEYQELVKHRLVASDGEVILVEGLE